MPDWPVCWWNGMRGGDGIRWLYKLVVAEFGEIGVTDGIVLNGLWTKQLHPVVLILSSLRDPDLRNPFRCFVTLNSRRRSRLHCGAKILDTSWLPPATGIDIVVNAFCNSTIFREQYRARQIFDGIVVALLTAALTLAQIEPLRRPVPDEPIPNCWWNWVQSAVSLYL